jgi:hypothetical protein
MLRTEPQRLCSLRETSDPRGVVCTTGVPTRMAEELAGASSLRHIRQQYQFWADRWAA